MIFQYIDYNKRTGICDIEVHNNIVIATELANNKGASITNCAEMVATQVVQKLELDIKKLVWIEHYSTDAVRGDTYDRVIFEIDESTNTLHDPKWTRINNIKQYILSYGTSHNIEKNANNGEQTQLILPEIVFNKKNTFKLINKLVEKGVSECILNGTVLYKIGHFRGNFEGSGFMWVNWHDGEYYNRLQTNIEMKTEIEAILVRLRTQVIINFKALCNLCVSMGQGSKEELELIGYGMHGLYVLRLIPMRGDYNLYLSGYSI